MQDLFKIFSEVTVASKYDPLARIKKQAMAKKLGPLKSFSNTREALV